MTIRLSRVLLVLAVLPLCAQTGAPAVEAQGRLRESPEATVRAFLDAVPDREVNKLQALLADTRTCHITQESDANRPGIWVEPWADWLKWIASIEQSDHVIDKIATTKITDDLATVTLTAHTDDNPRTDLRAVVVLTRKNAGQWRIISWTQENTPQPKR